MFIIILVQKLLYIKIIQLGLITCSLDPLDPLHDFISLHCLQLFFVFLCSVSLIFQSVLFVLSLVLSLAVFYSHTVYLHSVMALHFFPPFFFESEIVLFFVFFYFVFSFAVFFIYLLLMSFLFFFGPFSVYPPFFQNEFTQELVFGTQLGTVSPELLQYLFFLFVSFVKFFIPLNKLLKHFFFLLFLFVCFVFLDHKSFFFLMFLNVFLLLEVFNSLLELILYSQLFLIGCFYLFGF